MTLTHAITQQAAHHAIAARLSCETQSVDEAAGLYIAAVSTNDRGLEVTVVDEHGHTRTVTLASPAQAFACAGRETRSVQIPACEDHDGRASITVTLPWVCPSCGGPRGEIKRVFSYDGSRRLACDGWDNPCGYVDYYSAVRREAREFNDAQVVAGKSPRLRGDGGSHG